MCLYFLKRLTCIFILKETSLSGFGYTPSSSGQDDSVDIFKLKEEISVLKKERDALQSEKVRLETALQN